MCRRGPRLPSAPLLGAPPPPVWGCACAAFAQTCAPGLFLGASPVPITQQILLSLGGWIKLNSEILRRGQGIQGHVEIMIQETMTYSPRQLAPNPGARSRPQDSYSHSPGH